MSKHERVVEAIEASGLIPSNGNDQQDRALASALASVALTALESPHKPNGPYYPVGLLAGEYCKRDRKPWPCPDSEVAK